MRRLLDVRVSEGCTCEGVGGTDGRVKAEAMSSVGHMGVLCLGLGDLCL